jgi:hypothetical protein
MENLKEQLRAKRDTMSSDHATRLHRSISWLQCAEKYNDDDDIGFISTWIAFNALYGVDVETDQLSERASFAQFIGQLVELDADNKIHHCLWMNYSGFVKAVVNNQYVYAPFWKSQRVGDQLWEDSFSKSKKLAMTALANSDVALLLEIVLDRLYVLRNQLMHGGATYQSKVNRDQVKDGRRMLMELLPIIVNIMLNEKDRDWGKIYFPVV